LTGLEIFTFAALGGIIVFITEHFYMKGMVEEYENEILDYKDENQSLVDTVNRQNNTIDVLCAISKVTFDTNADNHINNKDAGGNE